jgi:integrase
MDSLREHRARQYEDRLIAGTLWQGDRWGDLVFATATGGPLSGTSVTHRLERLVLGAGVRKLNFQDLRHGCATLQLALGVDMRTIMENLGHSQISTTMNIYAGVIDELKEKAAARLDEAVFTA